MRYWTHGACKQVVIERLVTPTDLRKLLEHLESALAVADELKLDRVGIDIATACFHLEKLIGEADLRSGRSETSDPPNLDN